MSKHSVNISAGNPFLGKSAFYIFSIMNLSEMSLFLNRSVQGSAVQHSDQIVRLNVSRKDDAGKNGGVSSVIVLSSTRLVSSSIVWSNLFQSVKKACLRIIWRNFEPISTPAILFKRVYKNAWSREIMWLAPTACRKLPHWILMMISNNVKLSQKQLFSKRIRLVFCINEFCFAFRSNLNFVHCTFIWKPECDQILWKDWRQVTNQPTRFTK